MKRLILWFVVMGLAVIAPALVLNVSPHAATQDVQRSQEQAPDLPSEASYRSPSGRHKIQINDSTALEMVKARNGRTVADYGTFAIVEVDSATADELTLKKQGEWRDDYNVLMLSASLIDTTSDEALKMQEAGAVVNASGRSLHLVQFRGPIKPEWYQAMTDTGVEVVTYIPNNAYIVYGDRQALRRVRNLAR